MELRADFLISKLRKKYCFSILGALPSRRTLFSRPIFLTASVIPQNHQILIKRSRNTALKDGAEVESILIMQGDISESIRRRFSCVLCFDIKDNLYDIVNDLQSIYDDCEAWTQRLLRLTRSSCTLTRLLDEATEQFGNPLMITDSSLQLIAYSSIIDANAELSFLLDQAHSPDLPNNYLLFREFRDTYLQEEADYFTSDFTGVNSMFKNIFQNGQELCRIILPGVLRPLEDSDLFLLEVFSNYVADLLLEGVSHRSDMQSLSSVLQGMLESGFLSEDAKRILSYYNWTEQSRYLGIEFQTNYIDAQQRIDRTLIAFFHTNIPASCAFDYRQRIILFINLSLNGRNSSDIVASLTTFIRNSDLRAGISIECSPPQFSLFLLYQQAHIALEMGKRYFSFRWIHHFSDIRELYLLERCVSELPAKLVISPAIQNISEYDDMHGTDYLLTLRTYLDNNLQSVRTAELLYVHRSTFVYRIRKLTEQFHIDLSNADQRFFYQLSIRLLDQTRRQPGFHSD